MSSDVVALIKEKIDIVDLVSSYVRLTKAGRSYRGLSPFKKEKTPSFFVSPDKGAYYCFSTQKGGDIFTFVEEMERVDFQGALKILAEKANVTLEQIDVHARDTEEKLHTVMERSKEFYHAELLKNDAVREYLSGRGITENTISEWKIGYAPPPTVHGWDYLLKTMKKESFSEEELSQAGLIKWKDETDKKGQPFDRFRSRIMFPLNDVSGRTVAFSGRLFPDDKSGKAPKYLNSPETRLYHKSTLLYGMDVAKNMMRKYDFAILVEGQFDLVLSHQAGFPTTVAVSGTGLTSEHMESIARMTKRVVLAFDGDSAGVASTFRGARMALSKGMEVKVVRLPIGIDPADTINTNPEEWKRLVREAESIVPFALSVARLSTKNEQATIRYIREYIIPLIASMEHSMDRSHSAQTVAEFAHLSSQAVLDEIEAVKKNIHAESAAPHGKQEVFAQKKGVDRRQALERLSVGIWLRAKDDTDFDEEEIAHLLQLAIPTKSLEDVKSMYNTDEALPFEIEMFFEGTLNKKALAKETIHDLRLATTKETFQDSLRALHEAEDRGDQDVAEQLLTKLSHLSKELAELERTRKTL